jgi:hypothetical protein
LKKKKLIVSNITVKKIEKLIGTGLLGHPALVVLLNGFYVTITEYVVDDVSWPADACRVRFGFGFEYFAADCVGVELRVAGLKEIGFVVRRIVLVPSAPVDSFAPIHRHL